MSIPITGLGAQDPTPGVYNDVLFAQGASALGLQDYAILLVGNKTSAGSATVDTVVYGPTSATPLVSVQDAISLFGTGSELHRMFLRVTRVNPDATIYAIAVTASGGTAASLVVTYTNTAAASGTVRTWIGDEFVDASVASGDDVTAIATAVKNAINSKTDWPVTAANTAGVLTMTAKIAGPRGNWLRGKSVVLGTGVATSSDTSASTFFTLGATADSNSAALATIASHRYYYIVSAAEDATQLGALVTQVNSQALPVTGIRQRVFAGSVDTSGNVTTIATGLNAARADIVWLQNSDVPPSELAATLAGVVALEEAPVQFKCNFSGYGNAANDVWPIKAPLSGTIPSRATIKAALNNGISPIGVNANGTTYLVKLCTTRSLNGSNPDYRIRDHHKVTVCDRFADDLTSKMVAQFSGKNIADDPQPGGKVPPNAVTPRVMKAAVAALIREYGDNGLVENVDSTIANTVTVRETSPTNRMTNSIPLDPIDILDQIGDQILQIG